MKKFTFYLLAVLTALAFTGCQKEPVVGVTLDQTSAVLHIGNTQTLTATIAPDDAANKAVTWESSDPAVATVNDGLVTAVAEGAVTITVITADGNKTATCAVTVLPLPQITMVTDDYVMYIRMTGTGSAIINWGDGTMENCTLTSDESEHVRYFSSDVTSHTVTITGNDIATLGSYTHELTSLDVSKCTTLTHLICQGANLTELDVSRCTALTYLDCMGNQLTALDVSKNTNLNRLYCSDNRLTAAALNALFGTLPYVNKYSVILIGGNPGMDRCDRSIATAKGWNVSF